MGTVGANNPGWIGRRLNELRRDRVAGGPQLRRLVIYRIGAAQNFGRGMGRVFESADCLQRGLGARFIVTVKYMCCMIDCSNVNKFCSNLQHV